MPLARLWNDHDKPYTEKFEVANIDPPEACKEVEPGKFFTTIPPKGFVTMDWEDATRLASSFIPVRRLDSGVALNPKMLRVEKMGDGTISKPVIKCQACREEFDTNKELSLHAELKHAEVMVDEEVKKDALAKRK